MISTSQFLFARRKTSKAYLASTPMNTCVVLLISEELMTRLVVCLEIQESWLVCVE